MIKETITYRITGREKNLIFKRHAEIGGDLDDHIRATLKEFGIVGLGNFKSTINEAITITCE